MERIEDCISFLVAQAAKGINRRTRAKLSPHGVTPTQYAVLWVLWNEDDASAADVGARLGIDSATVTGVVDRLEAARLLERRPDPGDRRVHRLLLTERGRALRDPLDAAMAELNAEVASLLGDQARPLWHSLRTIGTIADP